MTNEAVLPSGNRPKLVSVVTPCYNEAGNVRELRDAVREQFALLPAYRYEHIYIDNASTDGTQAILRELAAGDPNVRVIINTRNFGQIRSPYHAVLQARGDVVICMASDFQDPPALIPDFLRKWEEGYKIVLGVKAGTDEAPLMGAVRHAYYRLLAKLAEIRITEDATGFGLYDRDVVQALRQIDDPYPYTRGLLADIGHETAAIPFHKPNRRHGITKNNFYTLYDMAMLGITNHSRVPLRLATMLGFVMSGLSFLLALVYLGLKLVFWYRYTAGMAPVLIGVLLFSSIQLFFIGILGEYIGTILTQVQKRPLVIEKERINFDIESQRTDHSGPPADSSPGDLTAPGRRGPGDGRRIAAAA